MLHKVAELLGRPLDAAVAKARGWQTNGAWATDPARPNDVIELGAPGEWAEGGEYFGPSTRWQDAGPIIEQERIAIVASTGFEGLDMPLTWCASVGDFSHYIDQPLPFVGDSVAEGPTPLIAAMRAYVASKLGAEVDLDAA